MLHDKEVWVKEKLTMALSAKILNLRRILYTYRIK